MEVGKKLNIHTNHSTQRRLYFDGNFVILAQENELQLIDFDLTENRTNVSDDEKINLYYGILSSAKYFGSHILKVHTIKLRIGSGSFDMRKCNINTSPNIISSIIPDSNKENHNLILYFKSAFSCGFRLAPESITYGFHDFWLQKNV